MLLLIISESSPDLDSESTPDLESEYVPSPSDYSDEDNSCHGVRTKCGKV